MDAMADSRWMLVEAWSLEKKPIGQGKKKGQDDVVPLSKESRAMTMQYAEKRWMKK